MTKPVPLWIVLYIEMQAFYDWHLHDILKRSSRWSSENEGIVERRSPLFFGDLRDCMQNARAGA